MKFARVRFRHLAAGKRGEAPQTIQARNFGRLTRCAHAQRLTANHPYHEGFGSHGLQGFALARAKGAEIPV
jgi:hypothetical protein